MEKSLKKETILLTSTINFICSISEEQNFIESLGAELRIIFYFTQNQNTSICQTIIYINYLLFVIEIQFKFNTESF